MAIDGEPIGFDVYFNNVFDGSLSMGTSLHGKTKIVQPETHNGCLQFTPSGRVFFINSGCKIISFLLSKQKLFFIAIPITQIITRADHPDGKDVAAILEMSKR